MSDQMIKLQAEKRSTTGSRNAQKLRAAKKIPAVIYGHKEPVVMVALDRAEVLGALAAHSRIVECALPDGAQTCLLKDVQYDHLGSEPIHVDLTRVSLTDRIRLTVPIVLRNTAKGIKDGGVMMQLINDLEVECLASSIPESFKVNVADLGLDDVVLVKQLTLPQGVTTDRNPEDIVCQVKAVKETEVLPVTPAEPGAEPEVQTKGKKDEEGAEGAAPAAKKE